MKNILRLMLVVSLVLIVGTMASCALLPRIHFYGESVVNPTCTEQGYTLHKCRLCEESYQDNFVDAFGHDYQAAESVVAPTCTEQGYTTYQCSRCEQSYQDDFVEALAHSYEATNTVAPGCGTEGYTEYTCSDCKDVRTDDVTKALHHRFNGGACLNCQMEAPTDRIEPNTDWYSETTAVFVLKTKEELAGFAQLVNEGADFVGRTVRLGADIDLGYAEWTPIGTASYPFTGTFSGEKYTVSGLKITASGSYVGLFGNVKGNIYNLSVVGASVYAPDTVSYVGAVVGRLDGQLTSVSATGYVDARTSECVGGVAGYVASSTSFTDLVSDVFVAGGNYTGGVVGRMQIGGAIVSGLVATAPVTGEDFVGGAVGSLASDNVVFVEKITVTGDVYGNVKVGGAIGYLEGKVNSNIKNVSVSADVSGKYYVGGLIGHAVNVALEDSTNAGSTVEARDALIDGTFFYAYLGGYVGYGYSVKGCNNTVAINYISRGMYVGGIAGYLVSNLHDCENNAPITGYNRIGGLVGGYSNTAVANLYNLKNTGDITAVEAAGGIIGWAPIGGTLSMASCENTGAIVVEEGRAGGIVGILDAPTQQISANTLKNTGDVTSKGTEVGGLFGQLLVSDASIVRDSESAANVIGKYRVGGLIGFAKGVALQSCSNAGSSVLATGWKVEDTEMYAYLGGYIGQGGKAVNCVNEVALNYTGIGLFVGGIIGYTNEDILGCTNNAAIFSDAGMVGGIVGKTTALLTDCVNNGDVTSSRDTVGGIAGMVEVQVTTARTYSGLTNNGAVSGQENVGGVIGRYRWEVYYGCCRGYRVAVTFKDMTNNGAVSGGAYVGGISGCTAVNNTGDFWCDNHGVLERDHNSYSYFNLAGSNCVNTGMVSGTTDVGEIFGLFWSDGDSTLKNYTVIGQKTVNGEVLTDANYDVGYSTRLTLSEREIYVEEVPEVDGEPNGDVVEDTEDSENGENEENTGENA